MKTTSPFKTTWVTSDKVNPSEQHVPVTQVYCWIISKDGQVCIVSKDNQSWQLPGGHPLPGENISQTVVREVAEEAGLDLSHSQNDIQLFGYNNVKKLSDTGTVIDHFLQLRTYCFIDKLAKDYILLPQEKPTEKIEYRIISAKFVTMEKLLELIPWLSTSPEYNAIKKAPIGDFHHL